MLLTPRQLTVDQGQLISPVSPQKSTSSRLEATGTSQAEARTLRGSQGGSSVWQEEAAKRHSFVLGEESWPVLQGSESLAGGKVVKLAKAQSKNRQSKSRRQNGAQSSLTVLASKDFAVAIDTHENLRFTIAMQRSVHAPTQAPSVLAHSEEEIDLCGTFFMRLFDAEYTDIGCTEDLMIGAALGFDGSSVYSVSDGRVFTGYFYPQVSFHSFKLGHDATRICREPNAGGQSTVSEVRYIPAKIEQHTSLSQVLFPASFQVGGDRQVTAKYTSLEFPAAC
jgi:hypothetical protein